jgi:hypothetical protein
MDFFLFPLLYSFGCLKDKKRSPNGVSRGGVLLYTGLWVLSLPRMERSSWLLSFVMQNDEWISAEVNMTLNVSLLFFFHISRSITSSSDLAAPCMQLHTAIFPPPVYTL